MFQTTNQTPVDYTKSHEMPHEMPHEITSKAAMRLHHAMQQPCRRQLRLRTQVAWRRGSVQG